MRRRYPVILNAAKNLFKLLGLWPIPQLKIKNLKLKITSACPP
jgi:hypothetical protein